MSEQLLKIDGVEYDINLTKINRSASILDKYARRTLDGDLQREIIGTYYNYSLEFSYSDKPERYKLLWDTLTAPEKFRRITIVDTTDTYEFVGYIANVKDNIVYASPTDGQKRMFANLSCDIVAKKPSRIPN